MLSVCDLRLDAEKMSVSLNREWLAKYAERSQAQKAGGLFERQASRVGDSEVKWLREKLGDGLSVPYSQIQKVAGKTRKGGPKFKKQGNPVEYDVRFDFNKGEHFWSESYVEFMLTAGECAAIQEYITGEKELGGRVDFQQP